MTDILSIVLPIWNLVVFALFGLDKAKAKKGMQRIPEKTLFLCAFLLGGVGGMAGMLFFRHKTKHLKFQIMLPLAMLFTLGAVAFYLYLYVF